MLSHSSLLVGGIKFLCRLQCLLNPLPHNSWPSVWIFYCKLGWELGLDVSSFVYGINNDINENDYHLIILY